MDHTLTRCFRLMGSHGLFWGVNACGACMAC
jgi:hypothetical protein